MKDGSWATLGGEMDEAQQDASGTYLIDVDKQFTENLNEDAVKGKWVPSYDESSCVAFFVRVNQNKATPAPWTAGISIRMEFDDGRLLLCATKISRGSLQAEGKFLIE
ncbi:hypothetical protein [Sorangium sp. So ce1389]|uniref:hypothetical protein n=1 Tax=Sorangium sp. So ce1389 TaxID=3133336 RepID=UPI003F625A00